MREQILEPRLITDGRIVPETLAAELIPPSLVQRFRKPFEGAWRTALGLTMLLSSNHISPPRVAWAQESQGTSHELVIDPEKQAKQLNSEIAQIIAAIDDQQILSDEGASPEPITVPVIVSNPEPIAVLTQFELKINVEPGVPATDVQYVTDGINASRAYMLRHFGFSLDGVLTVNLKNDTTSPHAGYRYIEIGVLDPSWHASSASGRMNTAAHETGHELQYILAEDSDPATWGNWGDWFLVEGTAQYIADKSLTEAGYYPNNQQEACQVATVVRNPVSGSLRQIDASNPSLPVWSIASLAIQDMVKQFGEQVVPIYFRSVRTYGVEEAFRIATGGVNIDQFASEFDQKRRALTFPGTQYTYWVGKNPCISL